MVVLFFFLIFIPFNGLQDSVEGWIDWSLSFIKVGSLSRVKKCRPLAISYKFASSLIFLVTRSGKAKKTRFLDFFFSYIFLVWKKWQVEKTKALHFNVFYGLFYADETNDVLITFLRLERKIFFKHQMEWRMKSPKWYRGHLYKGSLTLPLYALIPFRWMKSKESFS